MCLIFFIIQLYELKKNYYDLNDEYMYVYNNFGFGKKWIKLIGFKAKLKRRNLEYLLNTSFDL